MWHENPDNLLVEPGDVGFWKGFWKSDAFRRLIDDPSTGYASVMEKVAARPWWFITPTQSYENRHFSVWFAGALVRRHYGNPVIEDLYYWHDLLHGLTFADAATATETQWKVGMRANEVAVSMETEMLVYWRAPWLRQHTFDFDIWWDMLRDKIPAHVIDRLVAWRCRRAQSDTLAASERRLRAAVRAPWPLSNTFPETSDIPDFDALWEIRRAVTASPRPSCAVETELARYESQAEPFYDAWVPHWREVEGFRREFLGLVEDGRWRLAVDRQKAMWCRHANADGVPFGALAQALAAPIAEAA